MDDHDLTLVDATGALQQVYLPPGGSAEIRATLTPGDWKLYCSLFAGTPESHEQMGMAARHPRPRRPHPRLPARPGRPRGAGPGGPLGRAGPPPRPPRRAIGSAACPRARPSSFPAPSPATTWPGCATPPPPPRLPPPRGGALRAGPGDRADGPRGARGGGPYAGGRTARALVPARRLTLVPVLRAGLAMLEPALELLPDDTRVGFLGMARDEETLRAAHLPREPARRASRATRCVAAGRDDRDRRLQRRRAGRAARRPGRARLRLVGLIAAPEGLAAVAAAHPDVPITVAAIDERLDERGFIVPGPRRRRRPPLRRESAPG